jgi:hypothetical protein
MTITEASRRGGCIYTYSGRFLSLTAPQQEDIVLGDVAHHLALINRHTGATSEPISVAQHSVLVSYLVPETDALDGLHHDDPEFALTDVSSPLKRLPQLLGYRDLEKVMHSAIARKFGLSDPLPAIVHVADFRAWQMECHRFFGEPLPVELEGMFGRYGHLLEPWSWQLAEHEFLRRHWELSKGREVDGV